MKIRNGIGGCKCIVKIFVGTVFLFVVFTCSLLWDGFHDDIKPCDMGLVFGNTVYPNGAPSPRLTARLDRAIELYHKNFFSVVFVSGGVGKEGQDEALVMREYLIQRGIPPAQISADQKGITTFHTATNAASLMKELNLESAMVVTQYFHVSRSKLAMKRCGVVKIFSAHAYYFEWRDLYSIPREVFGYIWYWFDVSSH